MPKKFTGGNRHQVEAREREEAKKASNRAQKSKADEDAKWADDSKEAQKKAERERKKREAEAAAAASRAAAERQRQEEEEALGGGRKQAPAKMTRAQAAAAMESIEVDARKRALQAQQQPALPDSNPNRAAAEAAAAGIVSATGVDDAIAALADAGVGDEGADSHPERRLKAAHRAYEERMLPLMRKSKPGLRLQQYKDLIWKKWAKAPENPLVKAATQRAAAAAAAAAAESTTAAE
eukprot:TRINITY_DN3580_c0_g1_i1.p1 TRINITY_DN3580_c0_g1~~TRINITY_DN3580_c0_g1_i1.p1  ORF type:complete len:237 (-),score=46.92 TRINITY_DN3580_c0_g1_i1:78-788(-)